MSVLNFLLLLGRLLEDYLRFEVAFLRERYNLTDLLDAGLSDRIIPRFAISPTLLLLDLRLHQFSCPPLMIVIF